MESKPIVSVSNSMSSLPWNGYPSTEPAPGLSIADPQTGGSATEPDSVSVEEYLAARAQAQSPVEPDSVSVEDYLALRAQQQASAGPDLGLGDSDTGPALVPRTVNDQFSKSELPEFPSSPGMDSAQAVSQPIAPADQPVAVQNLPSAPFDPAAEPTFAPQLPTNTTTQVNEPSPPFQSVLATPSASKLVVRTPPRTPEMNGVVRDAEKHNGRGFALATRGALLAARREFVEALRGIALQLDKDSETRHFTQALASGLAALDEADDFSPRGSKLDVELDLPLLVRGHRTPALKGVDVKDLSPLVAAGRYYTYAQEQLGMAAGGEMAGSLALYGLGKVHDMIHEQRLPKYNSALSKAMVFHQAALTTDPRNFRAANDMGVLLARAGRLEIAKAMLTHSLNVTSQPAVWRNLAAVHDQLGETELSARAKQLASASQAEGAKAFPPGANPNTSRFAVQWVDPATFAASSRAASDIQPTPANSATALNGLQPPPTAPKAAPSWAPIGNFPAATAPPAGGLKGLFTR
jgi:hypothetical protein